MRTKHLIVCIILFSLFFTTTVKATETVRITFGQWSPYFSSKLPNYGIFPRIIADAFALEGINVEFGVFPWARAKLEARSNHWDAAAGWSFTKKRARNFLFSEAVMSTNMVFFHRKNYPFQWQTIFDLKNLKVGSTISYFYGKNFQIGKNGNIFKLEEVPSDELNFKKLLRGRIDIFPNDLNVARNQMQEIFSKEQIKQITHHPLPISTTKLHVLFSKNKKNSKRLMLLLHSGLNKLKLSGQYQQYLDEFYQMTH